MDDDDMREWGKVQGAVGKAIGAALRARGITQATAADMAGVHQTSVSRWVKGQGLPEWAHLWKLARASGISPAEMLGPLLAGPWGPRADVAEALAADSRLTEAQRQAILGVYLSHVES